MAGALVGVISRAVDTAPWAPPWIGLLLTPWLAFAWLAGAVAVGPMRADPTRSGPLAGLLALGAVVASYLLTAGTDAPSQWPVLALLALAGGPAYGWAGATWRAGGRAAGLGLALIGAALVAEGIGLQLGERGGLERIGFSVEAVVGLLVVAAGARRRG